MQAPRLALGKIFRVPAANGRNSSRMVGFERAHRFGLALWSLTR